MRGPLFLAAVLSCHRRKREYFPTILLKSNHFYRVSGRCISLPMVALPTHLVLRAEDRTRVPLVPKDAARLIAAGLSISVETGAVREFSTSDYARAGCAIFRAGAWASADLDAFVLGVGVPDGDSPLVHRHLFFARSAAGPAERAVLLGRFARGGGLLLDFEALTCDRGLAFLPFDPRMPSAEISRRLFPHLLGLGEGTPIWWRAERAYRRMAAPTGKRMDIGTCV